MKPTQIVKAYRAVQELSGVVLPYRVSRGIAELSRRLSEEFDTIAAMEKNMLDEYGGTADSGGVIHFPSEDASKAFFAKYKEAMEQEDDIELPAVDLSKYVDSIRISAGAAEALEDIIIFESGGKA